MNEKTALKALDALAQTARLRVFRVLVGAAPEDITPGALSEQLAIPSSTLSFHLKELVNAGLVQVRREGRSLFYRPSFTTMEALVSFLTDHCCEERCQASGASDTIAPARTGVTP